MSRTLPLTHFDSQGQARMVGVAAKDVTLNYGLFVNAVINFLIVAFVLFLLIRQMNKLVAPPPAPEAVPAPSEEILLLREIRDNLKAR